MFVIPRCEMERMRNWDSVGNIFVDSTYARPDGSFANTAPSISENLMCGAPTGLSVREEVRRGGRGRTRNVTHIEVWICQPFATRGTTLHAVRLHRLRVETGYEQVRRRALQ